MKKNQLLELLKEINHSSDNIIEVRKVFGTQDESWLEELLSFSNEQIERILLQPSWYLKLSEMYFWYHEELLPFEVKKILLSMLSKRDHKVYYIVKLLCEKEDALQNPYCLEVLSKIQAADNRYQASYICKIFQYNALFLKRNVIDYVELFAKEKKLQGLRVLYSAMTSRTILDHKQSLEILRIIASAEEPDTMQSVWLVAEKVLEDKYAMSFLKAVASSNPEEARILERVLTDEVFLRQDYRSAALKILKDIRTLEGMEHLARVIKNRNVLNHKDALEIIKAMSRVEEEVAEDVEKAITNPLLLAHENALTIIQCLTRMQGTNKVKYFSTLITNPTLLAYEQATTIIETVASIEEQEIMRYTTSLINAPEIDLLEDKNALKIIKAMSSNPESSNAELLYRIIKKKKVRNLENASEILKFIFGIKNTQNLEYIADILNCDTLLESPKLFEIIKLFSQLGTEEPSIAPFMCVAVLNTSKQEDCIEILHIMRSTTSSNTPTTAKFMALSLMNPILAARDDLIDFMEYFKTFETEEELARAYQLLRCIDLSNANALRLWKQTVNSQKQDDTNKKVFLKRVQELARIESLDTVIASLEEATTPQEVTPTTLLKVRK